MMNRLIKIILIAGIVVSIQNTTAQNKKKKLNKGTSRREIRKRQQKAFEQDKDMNAFNALQPMGSKENDARDDILWDSETANTVYRGAGNISLTSPSRYGLKPGLELSSVLPLNYWVPNLALKKRWSDGVWYVASKHGIYSATPGIRWAQKQNFTSVTDSAASIPFIISMSNELLISRFLGKDNRCSNEQPFVILTFGIGADVGFPIGDSGLTEMKEHLLTNRSPALTGNGAYGHAKVRADWQMNSSVILSGGLKYFYGNFTGHHAFEQTAELQTFIISRLSFSFGYVLSIANYNTPGKVNIFPLLDINWYFGKRQGRQKGLWGNKVF